MSKREKWEQRRSEQGPPVQPAKPEASASVPATEIPIEAPAEKIEGPPCPLCGNGEWQGRGVPRSMSSDGANLAMACCVCGHSWMHKRRPIDDYRRCKACWSKRGGVYVATTTQIRADGTRRRYYRCAKCGYCDSVELETQVVSTTKNVVATKPPGA